MEECLPCSGCAVGTPKTLGTLSTEDMALRTGACLCTGMGVRMGPHCGKHGKCQG